MFQLFKKVYSQSQPVPTCDPDLVTTPNPTYMNAFCEDSSKLCSYENAVVDNTDPDNPSVTFSAIQTISGISDGNWVFFDSIGNIIPATSTTTPAAGYYFDSSATSVFDLIPSPSASDVPEYYINKYNGNKIYQFSTAFTHVPTVAADQAYLSNNLKGLILCKSSSECDYTETNLLGYFFINSGDKTKIISCTDSGLKIESIDPDYSYYIYSDTSRLIDCSSGTCTISNVVPKDTKNTSGNFAQEGYYLGGTYDDATTPTAIIKALIYCSSDYGCEPTYDESNTPSVVGMLNNGSNDEVYFANSGAAKSTKPLIKFDSTPAFTEVEASGNNIYYLNGELNSNSAKPLIYC